MKCKIGKQLKPERQKLFLHFTRFLKDKGVFHRFFEIMDTKPYGMYRNVFKSNIVYFFNECMPDEWTTNCFTWSTLNEGHDFWSKIHNEWSRKVYYSDFE